MPGIDMKADRRMLLAWGGVAIAGAGAAMALRPAPLPAGELAGVDLARGHRLRQGGFPAPSRHEQVDVVIAGGGVAGLAAAWRLHEAGFDRFRLIELEDHVGGNARSGRNHVSAY